MRSPLKSSLAALALAGAAATACGSAGVPASAPSPLAQKPLPEFKRPALDGSMVDIKALRGRPVVVKFFAEYCEPCTRTLPAAEELHRERPDVAFIGISEDELASTAAKVRADYSLTFPVVHDRSQVLAGRFRVSEMPYTFVADAQGVVRWVGGPDQDEADLAQAVDALAR